MVADDRDILEKLADLHHQATTERSHYYVASCVNEAMVEIMRLRQQIVGLEEANKFHKGMIGAIG
jgi:hypothetical protein